MDLRRGAATGFVIVALAMGRPAFSQIAVSGTVTSVAGPVAGARVDFTVLDPQTNATINEFNVLTAADGTFSGSLPGPSKIHLLVQGPPGSNFVPEQLFNIEVTRNVSFTIPLVLPVSISGRADLPAGHQTGGRAYARSLSNPREYSSDSADGSFELQVAPDRYAVEFWPSDGTLAIARATVDARGGHAATLAMQVVEDPKALPPRAAPPKASLISISSPDSFGVTTIRGQAGSVDRNATVLVENLQTAQVNLAVSEADGSFVTQMFAPPSSFIGIKHDTTGRYLPRLFPWMEVPAGTILHVPPDAATIAAIGPLRAPGTVDFHRFTIVGAQDVGQWQLTAPFDAAQWKAGESFTIGGTATILSRDFDASFDPSTLAMSGNLTAELVFDANGQEHQYHDQFTSVTLTPTGLPIDDVFSGPSIYVGKLTVGPFHRISDGKAEASWSVSAALSSNLAAGYYRLIFSGVTVANLPRALDHRDVFPPAVQGVRAVSTAPMRIVRIGAPARPHIITTLVMNDGVQGARGVIAEEDRGKFSMTTHVTMPSDTAVLPMTDARTAAARVYSLEPFLPVLSTSNGNVPDPPQIPLKLAGAQVSIRVVEPDGAVDDLGSAPLLQNRNGSPASQRGFPISGTTFSSGHVSDYYQLTTLDEHFSYRFSKYGPHRVIVSGSAEDDWGNIYDIGGTYAIDVARPLDIRPAAIPGTPLEIGNALTAAVTLQPPVPAFVSMRVTHLPDSDRSRAVTSVIEGHANRFGYFGGASPARVVATSAGEYRVDVVATYTDSSGTKWEGNLTWGSVVENAASRLRGHGRRGFQNASRRDAWLFVRNADRGAGHLQYPFHHGDVMWMEKNDNASDATSMSIEDTEGSLAQRVRKAFGSSISDLEARIVQGEIPLLSSCYADGCLRGYYYGFASRPDLRVREVIAEDSVSLTYWRFHDYYEMQTGNGANGDLPNDFKFQFGGIVFRDPQTAFNRYAAYGSLFVLLPDPDKDGGRVFPPFQGNGGGPSVGPLFTLKGKPIDLFFHPTATRPGSILQIGDLASFAGYAAPTLPAKVEIRVLSPSGAERIIRGQANKVGYFYDPSSDFPVHEAGIWTVTVKTTFDGVTSAGQVTTPFPTGDVLGSREGEFFFYVVDGSAPQLELAPMPAFVRPADGIITLRPATPAGLNDAKLTYTTTMPGFILEEGTSSVLSYGYDAQRLATVFPNLDLHDDDGFAGIDPITITLFVSGTDGDGAKKFFARQIVLQGEEVQMPEQKPMPPRRRPVRH